MRLPYGPDTVPVDSFNFEEEVDGRDTSKYLWGNAAYAMGARLTEAFALYGWCASIRGVENGGLVQDLPLHTFLNARGEIENKCPTEVIVTDRREKELADLGFMALTHCKKTDYAAFFSAQSCQKPFEYDDDAATANARLSTQLPYILMTSRFAHYLKAIARDKIGSLDEPVRLPDLAQQLDHELRHRGRQRRRRHQEPVPAPRGPDRRRGRPEAARAATGRSPTSGPTSCSTS